MPEKQIQPDNHDIEIPDSIIESFARFLVPEIRKYYASEQGQKEFEQWKQEQKDKKQT